jgi:hypothetical protein
MTPNTTPTPADRQEAAGILQQAYEQTLGKPVTLPESLVAGEDGALPELPEPGWLTTAYGYTADQMRAYARQATERIRMDNDMLARELAAVRQADGAFMRGFKEAKRQDLGAYDRGVISGLRQAASICSDREDMTADALRTEIEAALATHPAPAPTDQPEALSAAGEDGALPELPPLPEPAFAQVFFPYEGWNDWKSDQLAGLEAEGNGTRVSFSADQMHAYARAAQALVRATPRPDLWRHVKTGVLYERLSTGLIQSKEPLHDLDLVVIYRGKDGTLWARRYDEFNDRFVQVSGIGTQPEEDKGVSNG